MNVNDAKILLKATKAKLILVSASLQSLYGKPTQQVLREIDPGVSLVVLEEDFAAQDPGEAAEKVLSRVREVAMVEKAG